MERRAEREPRGERGWPDVPREDERGEREDREAGIEVGAPDPETTGERTVRPPEKAEPDATDEPPG